MKIVTVNLPVQYINTIAGLVGEENNALYPSRSELIRVAIREFLIKELKVAKNIAKGNILTPIIDTMKSHNVDESSFVNVPTDIKVGTTVIQNFKRYRIISREEKFQ